MTAGLYPGMRSGVTLGSDGCGEVVSVDASGAGGGSSSSSKEVEELRARWVGKKVVMDASVGWPRES